eukprot:766202-Hanusia_phi.AAC.2
MYNSSLETPTLSTDGTLRFQLRNDVIGLVHLDFIIHDQVSNILGNKQNVSFKFFSEANCNLFYQQPQLQQAGVSRVCVFSVTWARAGRGAAAGDLFSPAGLEQSVRLGTAVALATDRHDESVAGADVAAEQQSCSQCEVGGCRRDRAGCGV